MILVSSCSCIWTIHWSQVLSREWRCSWSSARRCSNCIWLSDPQFYCLLKYARLILEADNGLAKPGPVHQQPWDLSSSGGIIQAKNEFGNVSITVRFSACNSVYDMLKISVWSRPVLSCRTTTMWIFLRIRIAMGKSFQFFVALDVARPYRLPSARIPSLHYWVSLFFTDFVGNYRCTYACQIS